VLITAARVITFGKSALFSRESKSGQQLQVSLHQVTLLSETIDGTFET